tara:strand:+ start:14649 stop:15527 length:879 start_codon:yes stop_codon:yes gene_type:complete
VPVLGLTRRWQNAYQANIFHLLMKYKGSNTLAKSAEETEAILAQIKANRDNSLGTFNDDCDFPLSQGYSLIGTPNSVNKGVCWAMSYDWARFQIYDYPVQGSRFYNIRRETRLLQLSLNKAQQKQRVLELFARREGFTLQLVGEGNKPQYSAHQTLPAEYSVAKNLIECCFEPVLGDKTGVRMIGMLSKDGGHEIAIRVNEPYRVFDPNFGQYTLASRERMESFLRTLLLREYSDLMVSWDIYAVMRTFPGRQGATVPAHVAGPPAAVYVPVDAEATAESMIEDIFGADFDI